MLWYFWHNATKKSVRKLRVSYNNNFRKLFFIVSYCSTSNIFVSRVILPFNEILHMLTWSFITKLYTFCSENGVIKFGVVSWDVFDTWVQHLDSGFLFCALLVLGCNCISDTYYIIKILPYCIRTVYFYVFLIHLIICAMALAEINYILYTKLWLKRSKILFRSRWAVTVIIGSACI